ncbi:MAG TPA: hypothetical protein VGF13_03535, partial [Verrucomicrobiae bacterium]
SFNKTGFSPLERAANTLGAARLAYRLGDAEMYALACDRFSRALTRLVAQQRGTNYFHEWQPWHSMQPLDSMPPDWGPLPAAAVSNMPPDLARIWQDAQPVARAAAKPSVRKLERLIPGYAPTSFLASEDSSIGAPETGLIYTLQTETRDNLAMPGKPAWPRMIWPLWRTPSGAAWNFGQVAPHTHAPASVQAVQINSTTRVLIYGNSLAR